MTHQMDRVQAEHTANNPHDRTGDRVPRPVADEGHPHGRLSSWLVVITAIAGFLVGAFALIANAWWLMAAAGAVIVLCVPFGALVHIMDDTVGWTGAPPPEIHRGNIIASATKIYEAEHDEHGHLIEAAEPQPELAPVRHNGATALE